MAESLSTNEEFQQAKAMLRQIEAMKEAMHPNLPGTGWLKAELELRVQIAQYRLDMFNRKHEQ